MVTAAHQSTTQWLYSRGKGNSITWCSNPSLPALWLISRGRDVGATAERLIEILLALLELSFGGHQQAFQLVVAQTVLIAHRRHGSLRAPLDLVLRRVRPHDFTRLPQMYFGFRGLVPGPGELGMVINPLRVKINAKKIRK